MASVATAPNDSNDDRSVTEKKDSDDEDNGASNEDEESDGTVNLDLRTALLKNKEFEKSNKNLRAQYNRAVKLKEDNVRKHTVSIENRRSMYDSLKTRHQTQITEVKSTWKHREKDLKETHRADMVSKNVELRLLKNDVIQLEREKTASTQAIAKFTVTVAKGQATLTELRVSNAACRRSIEDLTSVNKELNISVKAYKKKVPTTSRSSIFTTKRCFRCSLRGRR